MADDARRRADGTKLTYLVDLGDSSTSGLDAATVEESIDRAMASWRAESCLQKVAVVKRPDTGADPDIFDSFYGYGGFSDFRAADIVHAGWMPPSFFDAVNGPRIGASGLPGTNRSPMGTSILLFLRYSRREPAPAWGGWTRADRERGRG